MTRYTIYMMMVLGSAAALAATAFAAITSSAPFDLVPTHNVTVIEKNLAYPAVGPLVVETCLTEDCSEA